MLYAFDPRRSAILLLGGNTTGNKSQRRKARGLTQEAMAELLGVSQAEVSKMERRSELYIGTLKKFIEAMNGELVLVARFADGVEVPIKLAETESAA